MVGKITGRGKEAEEIVRSRCSSELSWNEAEITGSYEGKWVPAEYTGAYKNFHDEQIIVRAEEQT